MSKLDTFRSLGEESTTQVRKALDPPPHTSPWGGCPQQGLKVAHLLQLKRVPACPSPVDDEVVVEILEAFEDLENDALHLHRGGGISGALLRGKLS